MPEDQTSLYGHKNNSVFTAVALNSTKDNFSYKPFLMSL